MRANGRRGLTRLTSAFLFTAFLLLSPATSPPGHAQGPGLFQAFPSCVALPAPDNAWPKAATDSLSPASGASVSFTGAMLLANDIGTLLGLLSIGPGSTGGGTVTGTGPFIFTFAPGFTGTDIFPYEIADSSGRTAVGLVKVSAVADTTAPVVSIIAPLAGTVSGDVLVSASASDDIGVAAVRFMDGLTQIGEVTAPPFQATWNTVSVLDGPHILTAIARDAAGNTATSSPVSVTVSNTPPDPDPLPTGLVLSFNFDAIAGTAVTDASGLNNHGIIRGAVPAAGKSGGALQFDGVDDWVTVADAASLDLTSAMTVEAWVNPDAFSGWETVALKERGIGNLSYGLYAHDAASGPAGYLNALGADRGVHGGPALTPGTWTHVATTYDGASQRLYINGALAASRAQTGAMAVGTGVLRIGGNSSFDAEFYKGRLDDVRVYNRALSAAEIAADMGGTPEPLPEPLPDPGVPGLVLALAFDEAPGASVAADSSGGARNGTVREAQFVPGKFGNALSFDGVNDWVTVPDSAALDLTSGMTIEAWVKPGTVNGWETLALKERGVEDFAYSLYAADGTAALGGSDGPAGNVNVAGVHRSVVRPAGLTAGAWTHVATTYDGATQRLYINGVLAASRAQTGAIAVSAGPLRIGGNNAWTGEFFQGLIDEVRIYNRALSASEVAADMAAPIR